jgi:hypothetical protein
VAKNGFSRNFDNRKNKVNHPEACFTIEYHYCHIDDQCILAAIVPCEQQVLIELAKILVIFGDFYVMFQRENHFINKRLQKPRRLNLKCIPGVNIVNKTNRNRYNSQS